MQSIKTHILIFALVLIHQLIGMLWYSPWLFAYRWLRLTELTPADLDPHNLTPFMVSIMASFALCYAMWWLFVRQNIYRVLHGISIALLLWFAFLFMTAATHAAFSQVSVELLMIDMAKDLIVFLVTGAGLALGRRRLEFKPF